MSILENNKNLSGKQKKIFLSINQSSQKNESPLYYLKKKDKFYDVAQQKKKFLKKLSINSYKKETEIRKIGIAIASAEEILRWAERTLPNGKIIGKVTNANTLHYKTFKPQKGGLFCERIFGPLKDFECACGKIQKTNLSNFSRSARSARGAQQDISINNMLPFYKKKKESNEKSFLSNNCCAPLAPRAERENKKKTSFTTLTETLNSYSLKKYCDICDVEYTWSVFRRYQLGYIQLILPVTHVWFLKGSKSILANLLGLKKKAIISLTYNSETTVLETSQILIQKFFQAEMTPANIYSSWGKLLSKNQKNSLEENTIENNNEFKEVKKLPSSLNFISQDLKKAKNETSINLEPSFYNSDEKNEKIVNKTLQYKRSENKDLVFFSQRLSLRSRSERRYQNETTKLNFYLALRNHLLLKKTPFFIYKKKATQTKTNLLSNCITENQNYKKFIEIPKQYQSSLYKQQKSFSLLKKKTQEKKNFLNDLYKIEKQNKKVQFVFEDMYKGVTLRLNSVFLLTNIFNILEFQNKKNIYKLKNMKSTSFSTELKQISLSFLKKSILFSNVWNSFLEYQIFNFSGLFFSKNLRLTKSVSEKFSSMYNINARDPSNEVAVPLPKTRLNSFPIFSRLPFGSRTQYPPLRQKFLNSIYQLLCQKKKKISFSVAKLEKLYFSFFAPSKKQKRQSLTTFPLSLNKIFKIKKKKFKTKSTKNSFFYKFQNEQNCMIYKLIKPFTSSTLYEEYLCFPKKQHLVKSIQLSKSSTSLHGARNFSELHSKKDYMTKQINWKFFFKKAFKKALSKFINRIYPITITSLFLFEKKCVAFPKTSFKNMILTKSECEKFSSLFGINTKDFKTKSLTRFVRNSFNNEIGSKTKQAKLSFSGWDNIEKKPKLFKDQKINKNQIEKDFLSKYSEFFQKKLLNSNFIPQKSIKSNKNSFFSKKKKEHELKKLNEFLTNLVRDFVLIKYSDKYNIKSLKQSLFSSSAAKAAAKESCDDVAVFSTRSVELRLIKKINKIKKYFFKIPIKELVLLNKTKTKSLTRFVRNSFNEFFNIKKQKNKALTNQAFAKKVRATSISAEADIKNLNSQNSKFLSALKRHSFTKNKFTEDFFILLFQNLVNMLNSLLILKYTSSFSREASDFYLKKKSYINEKKLNFIEFFLQKKKQKFAFLLKKSLLEASCSYLTRQHIILDSKKNQQIKSTFASSTFLNTAEQNSRLSVFFSKNKNTALDFLNKFQKKLASNFNFHLSKNELKKKNKKYYGINFKNLICSLSRLKIKKNLTFFIEKFLKKEQKKKIPSFCNDSGFTKNFSKSLQNETNRVLIFQQVNNVKKTNGNSINFSTFFNNFYQFSYLDSLEDSYSVQLVVAFITATAKLDDIFLNYNVIKFFQIPEGFTEIKNEKTSLLQQNSDKNESTKSSLKTKTVLNQISFGNTITNPSFSGAGLLQKIMETLSPKLCLLQNLIDLKRLYKKIAELQKLIRSYKIIRKIIKKIKAIQINLRRSLLRDSSETRLKKNIKKKKTLPFSEDFAVLSFATGSKQNDSALPDGMPDGKGSVVRNASFITPQKNSSDSEKTFKKVNSFSFSETETKEKIQINLVFEEKKERDTLLLKNLFQQLFQQFEDINTRGLGEILSDIWFFEKLNSKKIKQIEKKTNFKIKESNILFILNKFQKISINQYAEPIFSITELSSDLFKENLKKVLKNKKKLNELRPKLIRRIKLLRLFLKSNSSFDSMILKVLPVLPADLRPIMKLDDQIAASDLNRLYQRIIYRNDRLKKFLKDSVTINSEVTRFAHRLLQEAVDNLIENGKSGVKPETDSRGRALKSLTNLLKGKGGRFRQNLLGKRVDYSGRSVIVVGPKLKLHECGLPYEMAIELFLPFLLKRLLNYNLAQTVVGAKNIIRTNIVLVKELLREIMKVHPILLNRAPTLHRLGIQAFQPKLVNGKAILLHPLVCPAFNADFDGDQMAVHVPITVEARAEALKLMFSRNNLLSSATGDPLVLPSQDMVLGCYYLTTEKPYKIKTTELLESTSLEFTSLEIQRISTSLEFTSLLSGKILEKNELLVSEVKKQLPNSCLISLKNKNLSGFKSNNNEEFKNSISLYFPSFYNAQHFFSLPFRNSLYYNSIEDALRKYDHDKVTNISPVRKHDFFKNEIKQNPVEIYPTYSPDLQSPVWVKWQKQFETGNEREQPIEIRIDCFGNRLDIFSKYLYSYDKSNVKKNQYIRTTPGKIIFNLIIKKASI